MPASIFIFFLSPNSDKIPTLPAAAKSRKSLAVSKLDGLQRVELVVKWLDDELQEEADYKRSDAARETVDTAEARGVAWEAGDWGRRRGEKKRRRKREFRDVESEGSEEED